MQTCDIILPIYNALAYVKMCINSIVTCTNPTDYHLYLINDASDTATTHYLQEQTAQFPCLSLHNSTENQGFIKSCNFGLSLGNSPYVLLINSDVIVTPHWLNRLIYCIESDNKIAAVNPLTNCAAQIDLAIAPGANFYGMNEILAQHSPIYPDVVTNVGFCLLLRRDILQQIGLFDEIYGRGYCEESDLCMRLTTQGYRTVVADNVYVYHQGQASFTDSLARYQHNRRIFDKRWKTAYWQQFRTFQKANPLKPIRDIFELPERWHPTPLLWTTYRQLLKKWQQNAYLGLGVEILRGLKRLPTATCPIPSPISVAKVTRPQRLRVTYLLNKLVIAGGTLSVVQLVNNLILKGIEARIACLFVDPEIQNWQLFTCPLIFKDSTTLIQDFPDSDIVVATHWTTAQWANEIVKQQRVKISVYYLQDYESYFFSDQDIVSRQQVKATYPLIEHKIVTSGWLQQLLANDGYQSRKICISTDLDTFYPRDVAKKPFPTIITMARPGTPWRGFTYVVEALSLVKQQLPEVEIVFFGDNQLFKQKISFIYQNVGVIAKPSQLAELYSQADVFLDGSDFQGFGRLALEAMACGTACVLTGVGGVLEYAQDEENCLLVPPRQPQAFATAILRILSTPLLRDKLIKNGLMTVKNYGLPGEIEQMVSYFQSLK